jgi:hypothetical protein
MAVARRENAPPLFSQPKGFTALFLWLGSSSTIPEAFFCNFQTWMCVFRLLLFDLF